MIFIPYPDEGEQISRIRRIRNDEYALLRLTYTMIDKNNLDANGILRELLQSHGIVDYEALPNGGDYGITASALFIQQDRTDALKVKFYRVANTRGDRRFSLETIKRRARDRELNEGDLLYISVWKRPDGTPQIYIINLTNNTPTDEAIGLTVGTDAISTAFERIKPRLQKILHGGFFDNSKGPGPVAPKDVGDTLEQLLGIATNNRDEADLEGEIEVKSKGDSATLDILFTLRPNFENTPVAAYEPNDRQRVSAFARLYGYDSDKHPGFSSLYITIGSAGAPQNNQGFYLDVDEDRGRVNLMRRTGAANTSEVTAFWSFSELKQQLYRKHPATLWVHAEQRNVGDMVQFHYTQMEFSRAPRFATFLSLIKAGKITYDWRGYVSKKGKYGGKNHGNAWRIKPNSKSELFGELETVNL